MILDNNGGNETTTTELLQAQSHVWHHTFNFINSMSLKCAVQLGIPEAIQSHPSGPITLPELVAALHIPPAKAAYLPRLIRVLIHSGFLSESGAGSYSLTTAGRFLVRDNPLNGGAFVAMVLDPVFTSTFHDMSAWFLSEKDDPTPFSASHGEGVYEHLGSVPKLNNVFNEAMAGDSSLIAEAVVNDGKSVFEGVGSLVDVAGGTGTMAKAIAAAFPDVVCTVLDRPHVVSGLEGSRNLDYVAGDMFESIPAADVVMLKWILHNWSDENCVRILKNSRKAVTSNGKAGKVIIIDMVLGGKSFDEKMKSTLYNFDMQMMVNVSGKERNEEELGKLFIEAGFKSYHIHPILGVRALIEVYP